MLELMFMLPLLFGFAVILYKVTMVMQVSINNAQYARSQIYVLTRNSPEFPRLGLRRDPSMFAGGKQDRMVLGVADIDTGAGESKIEPIATKIDISRTSSTAKGSSEAGENIKNRTKVRIRNTMAICTQLNVVPDTSNERWPFKNTVCRYEGMI